MVYKFSFIIVVSLITVATHLQARIINSDSIINVNYGKAYQYLVKIALDSSFSNFEDALFEIENAYYDDSLNYPQFKYEISFHVQRILLLAEANKSSIEHNEEKNAIGISLHTEEEKEKENYKVLLNWAIYTYMTDTTYWKKEDGTYQAQYPMEYETNDPFGKEDWEITHVSHFLKTKRGNCFSMAALYYIFSQALQSEAYLSTAPQHIFIQHKGFDGNYYNVELTTKTFPGSGTIKTCTYTTHTAVKSGISMRRLKEKEALALCFIQLANGFERKMRFSDNKNMIYKFKLQCAESALLVDSLCLNAWLLKEQALDRILQDSLHGILIQKIILQYGFIPVYNNWDYDNKYVSQNLDLSPKQLKANKYVFPELNLISNYFTLSEGKFPEVSLKTSSEAISFSNELLSFALSIDPLSDKFPSLSPYNAMADDPINKVDPDGKDVYAIIWNTYDGKPGDAAFAIDNYKETVNEDGAITFVPDGTVSYFAFWPANPGSITLDNFKQNHPGKIHFKKINNKVMLDGIIEAGIVDPPTTVFRIETTSEQDKALTNEYMGRYRSSSPSYNPTNYNGTDFVEEALHTIPGLEKVNGTEHLKTKGMNLSFLDVGVPPVDLYASTPNFLARSLLRLSIANPGLVKPIKKNTNAINTDTFNGASQKMGRVWIEDETPGK